LERTSPSVGSSPSPMGFEFTSFSMWDCLLLSPQRALGRQRRGSMSPSWLRIFFLNRSAMSSLKFWAGFVSTSTVSSTKCGLDFLLRVFFRFLLSLFKVKLGLILLNLILRDVRVLVPLWLFSSKSFKDKDTFTLANWDDLPSFNTTGGNCDEFRWCKEAEDDTSDWVEFGFAFTEN